MVDILCPSAHSDRMRSVRGKNTKPELVIRRLLYSLGYRYRIHINKLPGSPDLVFPRRKKVIFVHGCFWHRHPGCKKSSIPATNRDFWESKFRANIVRDKRKIRQLKRMGWSVLVAWECEINNIGGLKERLCRELDKD